MQGPKMCPHGIAVRCNKRTVIFLPVFHNSSRASEVLFVLPTYMEITSHQSALNGPANGPHMRYSKIQNRLSRAP